MEKIAGNGAADLTGLVLGTPIPPPAPRRVWDLLVALRWWWRRLLRFRCPYEACPNVTLAFRAPTCSRCGKSLAWERA